MYNAIDIAKWFMNNNLDAPRNTYDGNIKLQKLLFFAQLIHIARKNKPLIKEEFNAYDKGMVMEPIRLMYKEDYNLIMKAQTKKLDKDAIKTLELTNEIYGDSTANELSDMSHQFGFWKKYLNDSIENNGYKSKSKSKVPNNELKKEIDVIKDVLYANEVLKKVDLKESELDY